MVTVLCSQLILVLVPLGVWLTLFGYVVGSQHFWTGLDQFLTRRGKMTRFHWLGKVVYSKNDGRLETKIFRFRLLGYAILGLGTILWVRCTIV